MLCLARLGQLEWCLFVELWSLLRDCGLAGVAVQVRATNRQFMVMLYVFVWYMLLCHVLIESASIL